MYEIKLIMTFKNTLGNSFFFFLYYNREDIVKTDIINAMNLIKEKNIFQPKGYDIAECVSAKVVDSTTTEYNLTI